MFIHVDRTLFLCGVHGVRIALIHAHRNAFIHQHTTVPILSSIETELGSYMRYIGLRIAFLHRVRIVSIHGAHIDRTVFLNIGVRTVFIHGQHRDRDLQAPKHEEVTGDGEGRQEPGGSAHFPAPCSGFTSGCIVSLSSRPPSTL